MSADAVKCRKAAGSGLFSDVIARSNTAPSTNSKSVLLWWMFSEDSRADSGEHRKMLGNNVIAGILNLQSSNGSSNARWIRGMA
jgi:hypothetical protein